MKFKKTAVFIFVILFVIINLYTYKKIYNYFILQQEKSINFDLYQIGQIFEARTKPNFIKDEFGIIRAKSKILESEYKSLNLKIFVEDNLGRIIYKSIKNKQREKNLFLANEIVPIEVHGRFLGTYEISIAVLSPYRNHVSYLFILFIFIKISALLLMFYFFNKIINKEIINPILEISKKIPDIQKYVEGESELPEINRKEYKNEIGFLAKTLEEISAKTRKSMTEKYEANVKYEKERLIVNSARSLCHDLRKPLEIIKILINEQRIYFKESKDEEETLQAIKKLTDMFSEMMFLGKENTKPEKLIQVKDVLKTVIKECETLYKEKGIKVRFNEDKNFFVYLSEIDFSRVLSNILNNAFDAVKENGEIYVELEEIKKEEAGFLQCTIGNTGNFISEMNRKSIFEPFFTDGKANGTGLGLAICKKIIEDRKGTIYTQNSLERNSVEFIFTLPLEKEYFEEEKKTENKICKNIKHNTVSLALVEDSKIIRDFFQTKLKNNGFNVASFEKPEDFLQEYNTQEKLNYFDYVLTDYDFKPISSLNGCNFSRILKSFSLKTKIILCSHNEDFTDPDLQTVDYIFKKHDINWEDFYAFLHEKNSE